MPKGYQIGGSSPFPLLPFSPLPPNLPIDGLIVLGARLNPQGEPGRVARLRLLHALHLWRRCDCRAFILLTGRFWPGCANSEARAMADWGLSWAAENWGEEVRESLESCLILEEASLNTAASARHTLTLVQKLGGQGVGLVTDTLHLPRAHLLFKRHFHPQGIKVLPLPARGLARHYWRNRRFLWLGKMAVREGGAWLKVLGRLALRRL
ncbi:MAG: YdcF family protein [Thermodesulfobacteriota bacterium]